MGEYCHFFLFLSIIYQFSIANRCHLAYLLYQENIASDKLNSSVSWGYRRLPIQNNFGVIINFDRSFISRNTFSNPPKSKYKCLDSLEKTNWLTSANYVTTILIILLRSFSTSGETCCYSSSGELLDAREVPHAGGTRSRYHIHAQGEELVPFFSYFQNDLVPFLQCCQYAFNNSLCQRFLKLRPPTTCQAYTPPTPGNYIIRILHHLWISLLQANTCREYISCSVIARKHKPHNGSSNFVTNLIICV